MNTEEHMMWLRAPAYGLYHLDSLEESASGSYMYDIVPQFSSQFDEAAQAKILAALEWAIACDKVNWEDVLPALPHSDDFKRQHLVITRDRILKSRSG